MVVLWGDEKVGNSFSATNFITKTKAYLVLATGIEKPSSKVSFSMYCIVKVYYSTELACKHLLEFTAVRRKVLLADVDQS